MLYRPAGETGEKVSILGFGCMRLPVREQKAHLIDEDKAQAMLDSAIAHGVNYFDTAHVYHSAVPFQAGQSEVFLGHALKRQREKVFLATKLPSWYVQKPLFSRRRHPACAVTTLHYPRPSAAPPRPRGRVTTV